MTAGFVTVSVVAPKSSLAYLPKSARFSAADLAWLRTGKRPVSKGPRLSTPLPKDGSAPKGWTRVDVPAPSSSSSRSWRDRNRVWRCAPCGKRTRKASCCVPAPAGKRRDDRKGVAA